MRFVVEEYTDQQGRSPYKVWLTSLRDHKAQARIMIAVERMELGLLGDCVPIGAGLSELRIHFGPGYRVYFAKTGRDVFRVFGGGDKSTQAKDIRNVKARFADYKLRMARGAQD